MPRKVFLGCGFLRNDINEYGIVKFGTDAIKRENFLSLVQVLPYKQRGRGRGRIPNNCLPIVGNSINNLNPLKVVPEAKFCRSQFPRDKTTIISE